MFRIQLPSVSGHQAARHSDPSGPWRQMQLVNMSMRPMVTSSTAVTLGIRGVLAMHHTQIITASSVRPLANTWSQVEPKAHRFIQVIMVTPGQLPLLPLKLLQLPWMQLVRMCS